MASTSVIYTYIDTEFKKEAENILAQLGISPSSAIQMFYSQIALTTFSYKTNIYRFYE